MGKKNHGHSHGKGHGHHKHDGSGGHHHGKHDHHHGRHDDHHGKHDHHHGKHGFLLGTRRDDVLTGSNKNDFVFGLKGDDTLFGKDGNDWLFGGRGKDLLDGGKGNDKLFGGNGKDALSGGDGNDWLFGGKGKDVLDGGAGSDKVFGGKGDDVAVYTMAENTGADACGKETRDFYDGGRGKDTLQLVLTKQESELTSVQEDIAKFEAFLLEHANARGDHGPVFQFSSFNLAARDFEKLEVVIIGNDAPVAVVDAWEVNEDDVLVVPAGAGVLANDNDPDGKPLPLTAELVSGPLHGSLIFHPDGSFSYTPNADYFGPDSFSYQANDGADKSAVTTVSLTVVEVNDAPFAVEDSATVAEDKKIEQIDVLANDAKGPANESGQTLKIVSAHATHGSVGINPNGTLSYEPHPDYFGDDTIEYTIEDDGTTAGVADPLQANGQVLITVTEVNDAPIGVNDNLQVTRNSDGSPIPIKLSDLLANDSPGPANEASQTLEVLIERLPPMTQRGGSLEYDDSTQTLWYTPPDEFPTPANMDRFAYTIQDDGTTNGVPDPLTDRPFVNIEVFDADVFPV